MSWSPQQEAALKAVKEWHDDPSGKQVFRLFGYAGTGKTTLAKEIAEMIGGQVLFATFTGKAALVLRKKGCVDASTIHSLIYAFEIDDKTGDAVFKLNKESSLADASLLIVDEVSMVGKELADDLLSFDRRILVLGDPAQLPPVKDEGYFINAEPDIMLTEVHRQAAENPIIRMSMDIREGRWLTPGTYGESLVVKQGDIGRERLSELVSGADQLICGLNRSRTTFNRRIRALKGLEGKKQPWHPTIGDRLICLRNNRQKALFNGGLWEAEDVKCHTDKVHLRVRSLDEERDPLGTQVWQQFFDGTESELHWKTRRECDEFTFGWAITCHKGQGSQWDDVIIFDESGAFRESKSNWLYTAVTRAAEKVTVVM